MQYPDWIWHNGAIKRWAEATTHVMSHALHYGSSVFEGIRCYQTPNGPVIFRLTDHNTRLFASAKIYDMAMPYSVEQINAACREVIRANDNTTDYLRPVAYRGLGGFGLSADTPTDVAVAPDGTVYVAESGRIRRIAPDGTITTAAGVEGEPTFGPVRSGVPAAGDPIGAVGSIALAPDGSLVFSEQEGRIRKVTPEGMLELVSGVAEGERIVAEKTAWNAWRESNR